MQKNQHLIEREHEALLEEERQVLQDLVSVAAKVDPDGPHLRDAELLKQHLDDPFLLVIVGEVKSGKSSFINALLGTNACAVGPTPLTDRIHVLKHGDEKTEQTLEEYLLERFLPVELLREVCIVDTPGTNSVLRKHGEITNRFIPRADLVLFLTSIDRPYSESENQFLRHISDHWRKKVVFLLSKTDGRDPEDVNEVVEYVRRCCVEHHGFEPRVIPVSARLEIEEKPGSGFDVVRSFVRETINSGDKLRLKLESPLKSSITVAETLETILAERRATLQADHEWVQALDRQVEQSVKELHERSHQHLTSMLDLFHACGGRARPFFEETFRLRNIGLMRNSDRIQEKFQREVLENLDEKFTALMNEAIDWLIREELSLYERATQFLQEKVETSKTPSHLLPRTASSFEYRREELFREIKQSYDHQREVMDVPGEARRLMEQAQKGLMRQLGIAGGALVVGAGTLALSAPLWASVAGVAIAVGIGLAGFAVLPGMRRRANQRFQERLDEVTRKVRDSYIRVISGELELAKDRLKKGWESFLLFYRSESAAMAEQTRALVEYRRKTTELEQRLQRLLPNKG